MSRKTDWDVRIKRLHRANKIFFWVVLAMGTANVTYIAVWGSKRWDEVAFRTMQYVGMLIIMKLPHILKLRFRIEMPWLLSAFMVLFGFSSLVLGDGLDFYGKYPWWDSVLHAQSGTLLSLMAFWIIHVIMAENEKYIFLNKHFLALFIVLFSLGLGACWEILEYLYDSLAGTNSQQFMASTTGSILSSYDIPLCGHEALRDTMTDLMLDLAGALLVAIYSYMNHNKWMTDVERYKKLLDNGADNDKTVGTEATGQ